MARTGFCIHPADAVARIPKVGGTKDVNLAKLRRLAPTHVLVNVDENRRETVDAIRGLGADAAPQIVVTHPLRPAGQPGAGRADARASSAAVPSVDEQRRRAAQRDCTEALAATQADGRAGAARALPDLARPLDDGGARHLPLAHAGAHQLAHAGPMLPAARTAPRATRSCRATSPGWREVQTRAAQLRALSRSATRHVAEAQALCPQRECPAGRRRVAQLVRGARRAGFALPARTGRRRCGAAPQRLTRTPPQSARMDIYKPLVALLAIVNPIGACRSSSTSPRVSAASSASARSASPRSAPLS